MTIFFPTSKRRCWIPLFLCYSSSRSSFTINFRENYVGFLLLSTKTDLIVSWDCNISIVDHFFFIQLSFKTIKKKSKKQRNKVVAELFPSLWTKTIKKRKKVKNKETKSWPNYSRAYGVGFGRPQNVALLKNKKLRYLKI